MGYPRLEKLLKAETESNKRAWKNTIRVNRKFLEKNLTPTQWKKYTDGTLSQNDAFALADKKIDKRLDAEFAKQKARLDEISNTPKIRSVYGDSSKYGKSNLLIYDENNKEHHTSSFAGGGNYARKSTSIANALQAHDGFMRVFYDYAEANVPKRKGNWENVFGYGVGKEQALPNIDGGTGEMTVERVLRIIGFDSPSVSSDKWSLYYDDPKKTTKVKSFTTTKLPSNKMLNQRAFK